MKGITGLSPDALRKEKWTQSSCFKEREVDLARKLVLSRPPTPNQGRGMCLARSSSRQPYATYCDKVCCRD